MLSYFTLIINAESALAADSGGLRPSNWQDWASRIQRSGHLVLHRPWYGLPPFSFLAASDFSEENDHLVMVLLGLAVPCCPHKEGHLGCRIWKRRLLCHWEGNGLREMRPLFYWVRGVWKSGFLSSADGAEEGERSCDCAEGSEAELV